MKIIMTWLNIVIGFIGLILIGIMAVSPIVSKHMFICGLLIETYIVLNAIALSKEE